MADRTDNADASSTENVEDASSNKAVSVSPVLSVQSSPYESCNSDSDSEDDSEMDKKIASMKQELCEAKQEITRLQLDIRQLRELRKKQLAGQGVKYGSPLMTAADDTSVLAGLVSPVLSAHSSRNESCNSDSDCEDGCQGFSIE